MKQLLTLLAAATVGTVVSPSLSVGFSTTSATSPTPKFTTLTTAKTSGYPVAHRLSDTTAIISENFDAKSLFFDSTKVNTASKGLIDLNKYGRFFPWMNTISIFIDWNNHQTYLFDSTKVNTASKGFTSLNHQFYDFYRLSDTTAIFQDLKLQAHYFDFSTMKFTELNVSIDSFHRLSDTTAFIYNMLKNEHQTYFFDSTKINELNKGIIKINKSINSFTPMSDTTSLIIDSNSNAFWFDSKEITNASQGLTDLKQMVYFFTRISDTTALTQQIKTQVWFYFDATKINDGADGFIKLNKKLDNPIVVLNDTSVFVNEIININNDVKWQSYFFDTNKINEADQGFIKLNKRPIWIYPMSKTMAFIGTDNSLIINTFWLFDATKVNTASNGWISLNNRKGKWFCRLSDTTGIFTAKTSNTKSTFYFFQY